MLHARKDYTATIQQCDRKALCEIIEHLIQALADKTDAPTDILELIRQRVAAATRETIPADEPVFLIRAQDQVGSDAVRAWAHLHRVNGGSDTAYTLAMAHADLMERWPKKKPADVPQEAI